MKCILCSEEKEQDQFYIRNKNTGLRRKECKACIVERNRGNRAKNPERYARVNRDRYAKDPSKQLERCKARYQKDKAKKLASNKEWYEKNKQKAFHYAYSYVARRKEATPKWANKKDIRRFYENRPKGFEVDHIIPLQGKNVCGLHVVNNLQYLTKQENCDKFNHYDSDLN